MKPSTATSTHRPERGLWPINDGETMEPRSCAEVDEVPLHERAPTHRQQQVSPGQSSHSSEATRFNSPGSWAPPPVVRRGPGSLRRMPSCRTLKRGSERYGTPARWRGNGLDLMEVLRNFWEHEDDYPLLRPPHPTRSRRKMLDFLAEYGLSPAMRSLVHRSPESRSVVISDRLDVDLWRAKAQAVADPEPPTSGSPAHAGA